MGAVRAYFGASPVADMVLVIMTMEFLALSWRALAKGRPARVWDLVLALGPGVCLTLALRAALLGDAWPWVAVWITAALPLHVAEQVRRNGDLF